ncbi:Ammonium Transporter Family [Branchiostoma belcheri]|nr:Ammonium Transporter Family [Branchiostoma belcheri]
MALQGGGFYLLGIQVLAAASQIVWTIVTSYLVLKLVDVTVGLRVPLDKEILGADYCEHGVGEPDRDNPEGASEDDDDSLDNGSPRQDMHGEVVERKVRRRPSGGYCGHSFRQKHRIRLPGASSVACCCHCCQCQCHRYDELPSDCDDSEHELKTLSKKRRNVLSCCRRLVQCCKKRQEATEDGDLRRGDTHLKDVATNTGSLKVLASATYRLDQWRTLAPPPPNKSLQSPCESLPHDTHLPRRKWAALNRARCGVAHPTGLRIILGPSVSKRDLHDADQEALDWLEQWVDKI